MGEKCDALTVNVELLCILIDFAVSYNYNPDHMIQGSGHAFLPNKPCALMLLHHSNSEQASLIGDFLHKWHFLI